jgi:hypothetical protein
VNEVHRAWLRSNMQILVLQDLMTMNKRLRQCVHTAEKLGFCLVCGPDNICTRSTASIAPMLEPVTKQDCNSTPINKSPINPAPINQDLFETSTPHKINKNAQTTKKLNRTQTLYDISNGAVAVSYRSCDACLGIIKMPFPRRTVKCPGCGIINVEVKT